MNISYGKIIRLKVLWRIAVIFIVGFGTFSYLMGIRANENFAFMVALFFAVIAIVDFLLAATNKEDFSKGWHAGYNACLYYLEIGEIEPGGPWLYPAEDSNGNRIIPPHWKDKPEITIKPANKETPDKIIRTEKEEELYAFDAGYLAGYASKYQTIKKCKRVQAIFAAKKEIKAAEEENKRLNEEAKKIWEASAHKSIEED